MLLFFFFWITRKILATFAIFAKSISDLLEALLCLCLFMTRILLKLLFLLFLRYLQVSV